MPCARRVGGAPHAHGKRPDLRSTVAPDEHELRRTGLL
jgi:hypothetical protein